MTITNICRSIRLPTCSHTLLGLLNLSCRHSFKTIKCHCRFYLPKCHNSSLSLYFKQFAYYILPHYLHMLSYLKRFLLLFRCCLLRSFLHLLTQLTHLFTTLSRRLLVCLCLFYYTNCLFYLFVCLRQYLCSLLFSLAQSLFFLHPHSFYQLLITLCQLLQSLLFVLHLLTFILPITLISSHILQMFIEINLLRTNHL